MSLSVIVQFPAGVRFSPCGWQAAIKQAGFDLVLDRDFDPLTFSGFLPARYAAVDSGFEYSYDPGKIGKQSVTLVWHSDAREGMCAVIAAGCLSHATGGILVDDDGKEYPPDQAIGYAREWEAEFLPLLIGKPRQRPWCKFWH